MLGASRTHAFKIGISIASKLEPPAPVRLMLTDQLINGGESLSFVRVKAVKTKTFREMPFPDNRRHRQRLALGAENVSHDNVMACCGDLEKAILSADDCTRGTLRLNSVTVISVTRRASLPISNFGRPRGLP